MFCKEFCVTWEVLENFSRGCWSRNS